jgi:uncharacterized coiled-coil protein SlyX
MTAPSDTLDALRLKRRSLEKRIEELESGSARIEELGPDGFRDVTARTLVELHTELGQVGASIHRLLAALRKHSECSSC